MPAQRLAVPTFTYGTYRSGTGEEVTFTDELMRQLEKNTNAVIQAGVFKPAVGYDHMVYGKPDTDAHGHIAGVEFRNGVVHLNVEQPSEQFRSDVRAGRRLHVSGEFLKEFSFVDRNGKTVKLGPTVVGLAALGKNRPSIKNPAITSLQELAFGESVSAADAFLAREELRKSGFVAQTLSEGVHAFSEIEVDPYAFGDDKRQESNDMEEKDIKALIASAVDPIKEENARLKEQIATFSETNNLKTEAKAFCEKLREDKPLGKLTMERLEDLLSDPTIPAPARTKIRTFAEALAPTMLTDEVAGRKKKKAVTLSEEDVDELVDDEPEAVSILNAQHFADIDKGNNEALVSKGLAAFSEFKPELMTKDGKPLPVTQQMTALQRYVTQRDRAAS